MWALWGFIMGSIVTMVIGGLTGAVYAEMKYSKTLELWYKEWSNQKEVLWTNIGEDEIEQDFK